MNRTLPNGLFKKCVSCLSSVLMLTILIESVYGQSAEAPYANDVARQRLLIHITAHYLHTTSQGQIDMDSAVRIPSKVYNLSPLLAYTEGYSDGKSSEGSTLLDAGKIKEAQALLANRHDVSRLRLLLELGAYFLFKPGNAIADLDLASQYINEATALSEHAPTKWKIECLILKAYLSHQAKRNDESQEIFKQAIKLCEESGNTFAKGRILLISGKLLPYGHPSRFSNFEKALSIFETHHAKEKEIETISEMNIEHFIFKRYDLLEQSALKTVELEKGIGFHHLQYAYDALAYILVQQGDYVNALSFCNKSLASLSSKEDSVFIDIFLSRKGMLYEDLGKVDDAMILFNQVLENRSVKSRLYWYKAFLAKADMLNSVNRSTEALALLQETARKFPAITVFEKMYFAKCLGVAYEQLNNYDLADKNYNIFLALSVNFPVEYILGEFPDSLSDISDFYRRIGNTAKARQLLELGKPFLSQKRAIGYYNYYHRLFKIDSVEKRYVQAIQDLQLSEQFLDSALSQDQRKNVDELLVQYETEKKDKDIQLLKQQGELQKANLRQSQFAQRMSIAGAGLFVVIAGLLSYLYRTKQKSNTKLKHLLTEKEWLLKEVHHRVKNNLQTVLSLLESQSRRLMGNEALHAIQESQNRVYAMSLIHKKLYQSTNVASINMEDYLRDLIQHLRESFGQSGSIQFSIELEPIHLDVSQAVPLGLIVNEAITNSIKYAFTEESHDSEIFVSLSTTPGKVDLIISDNGVGMTQTEQDNPEHLGLKLMKGLTEDIDGSFMMNTEKGVSIQLFFVPNIPLQKISPEDLLTRKPALA